MRVLRQITWANSEKVIACDFDRSGKVAALVDAPCSGLRAQIDGTAYVLPPDWAVEASRVAWMGASEALLWPVDFHVGTAPHIGKIGPNGIDVLNLEYPLEIFSDRNLIALSYSEERVGNHIKIISFFSLPEITEVACVTDNFDSAPEEPISRIFEVEHAALDSTNRRFWFSAYATEYLWCVSIDNLKLSACALGCPRASIVAITCDGDHASVIERHHNSLRIYVYRNLGAQIALETQIEVPTTDSVSRQIIATLDQPSARLRGHANNMLAATTDKLALLCQL